jgi:hypothetical protein
MGEQPGFRLTNVNRNVRRDSYHDCDRHRPHMKLFATTRATRHTAFVVLLAWLFALASGVANACLLQERETHAHAGIAAVHDATVSAGHAGAVAGHDNDQHPASAPCQKVCSEGSQTPVTADLKVTQADCGPAPLVAVLWTPATPVVLAPVYADATRPACVGPPIRVRYSRLAL